MIIGTGVALVPALVDRRQAWRLLHARALAIVCGPPRVANPAPASDTDGGTPMPYAVYKLIHFLGLFGIVTLLAGAAMHALAGRTRAERPFGRAFAAAHGLGAFLVLLGGFGMLARLGIAQQGLPGWIYAKLGLWLALSAALILPYRGRPHALALLLGLPLLTVLGAAIALYKPF